MMSKAFVMQAILFIFSSPGRSPGKAIVLPPVSVSELAAAAGAPLALAKC